MSAALALLGFVRRAAASIPWQAWAIAGLLLAVAAYGCSEREAGGEAARQEIRKSNDAARDKADEATRSVQDCMGVWDRARGLCLRNGTGR